MKITVEQHHIAAVMRRVIGVVEKRNTITILSNVMLEARAGQLTARVSDSDMEALDVCPCEIEQEGALTVEAQKLSDIAKNFAPGSQIKMEIGADDPRLVVASGRSRFRLPILPAADFPTIASTEWPVSATLSAKDFAGIISRSAYSMAIADTRYVLNGLHLHSIGKKLRAVGTAGTRIAYSDTAADIVGDLSCIIPAKMVAEMSRRLGEDAGDALFEVNESRVRLTIGRAVLTSKRLDGQYVDYHRLIPSGESDTLRVDGDALLAAIKSVIIVAGTDQKVRSIRLEIEKRSLVITARDTHSDAREEVDIDYSGEPITLGMNGDNAVDTLSALDADVVEMEVFGAIKPVIWRKAGDKSTLGMFAPLRA